MTRLTLRYLTSADLGFADALRAGAGWNQTVGDWQRFLDLSPDGCLLAECEGRPVATATTIRYGTELGWIGMMLVHPDFRRRGIARVLLKHCIEILRQAGVKSIKLDATPAGREVYAGLGFTDEYTLTRYERDASVTGGGAADEVCKNVRSFRSDDMARILELDRAASGASREKLLERLIAESTRAIVYEGSRHEISGFGMARSGSVASYVGPIVATEAQHAKGIGAVLMMQKMVCDLPTLNQDAIAWAEGNGFRPQRTLTRMVLGENVKASAPQSYFAIAGPDLG